MHKKALSDIDHHQVFGNGTHPPAHGQCLPFAMPSLMCYPGRMHRSNSENSVSTIDISHDVVPLFKQGRFPSNPSVFEEEIKVKRAPYKPTLTTITTSTALKMTNKIASPTAIAEPMLKCLIVVISFSSLIPSSQIALASRHADDGTDSCRDRRASAPSQSISTGACLEAVPHQCRAFTGRNNAIHKAACLSAAVA
jgi:hypothetical protein